MSEGILGNATGGFGMPRSFVVVDGDGNEFIAVSVENVTVFDATPMDVRVNKTFASDNGVQVGENTITYRTTQQMYLVFPGEPFSIVLDKYDKYNYTSLQCIIAKYNLDTGSNVEANKVVLFDNVYEVNSSDVVSSVTKNTILKSIDLNITNDTEDIYVIHLFTYKEEEF